MHNKFVKGIASVLGAALVLGSVVMSAVPANAVTSKQGSDGYETTWTAQELVHAEDQTFEGVTIANAADGAVTVSFPGQWKQVFFNIPDGVMAANWKSVTFDIDGSSYNVKLTDLKGTDGAMRGVVIDYNSANTIVNDMSYVDPYGGDPAPVEADLNQVLYLDIMSTSESENSVTFKSVTIVTEKEVASVSSGNTNTGSDDANKGNDAPATPTGPKTGESMNGVLVVCVLGGLLLISVAGLFLTKQRKNR